MDTIALTTPIVVSAKTFNLVGVKFLRMDWPDFNGPVSAKYILTPYETTNGVSAESPTAPIGRRIDDVLTLAATRATAGKPALANAVAAVLAALQEIEHEKGTI